jgi:hypothetical protein
LHLPHRFECIFASSPLVSSVVYLNDDFLTLKPVKISDFFDDKEGLSVLPFYAHVNLPIGFIDLPLPLG